MFLDQANLIPLWDAWDLRALVLFSLAVQIGLVFFGRYRRKTVLLAINLLVWTFYLMAELLATIALGKLSNVRKNIISKIEQNDVLRSFWAPLLLFYLGGPDTITNLVLEENQLWLRHLIGLAIQGLRTSYALLLTWNGSSLSILAILMLVAGIIKYGERIQAIRSRVDRKSEGYIQFDDLPRDRVISDICNAKLLLRAYYFFQTLKPHVPGYIVNKHSLENLVRDFNKQVQDGPAADTFKIIEMELGFMYDMLFSKVGLLFTVLGCFVRSIRLFCLVGAIAGFLVIEKHARYYSEVDVCVTYALLFGAVYLEICDVGVQLFSDWAMLWKIKHQNNWILTPIFPLFRHISYRKTKRWSNLMGQFNFISFFHRFPETNFLRTISRRDPMQPSYKNACFSEVPGYLKELILQQLLDGTQSISAVNPAQSFLARKRGDWTLQRYECLEEFKWSIEEVEFDESIIIWHIATDVCYYNADDTSELNTAKMLSDYMLYILVICPSRFPICDRDTMFKEAFTDTIKIFEERGSLSNLRETCKVFLEERQEPAGSVTLERVRKLAYSLMGKSNKWNIMRDVWVEMLCYAANRCPVKNHAQWVRHSGELLTHVWLLLMHIGVTNKQEEIISSQNLEDAAGLAFKGIREFVSSMEDAL